MLAACSLSRCLWRLLGPCEVWWWPGRRCWSIRVCLRRNRRDRKYRRDRVQRRIEAKQAFLQIFRRRSCLLALRKFRDCMKNSVTWGLWATDRAKRSPYAYRRASYPMVATKILLRWYQVCTLVPTFCNTFLGLCPWHHERSRQILKPFQHQVMPPKAASSPSYHSHWSSSSHWPCRTGKNWRVSSGRCCSWYLFLRILTVARGCEWNCRRLFRPFWRSWWIDSFCGAASWFAWAHRDSLAGPCTTSYCVLRV